MAQGKAFTTEQREVIVHSLREYLELGFSRSKSCKMIGLSDSTLSKWVVDNEALSMKLRGWENSVNKLAMSNILDAIDAESKDDKDKKKETTKWWLERRMKRDFSTRTESDITTAGEPLAGINIIKP